MPVTHYSRSVHNSAGASDSATATLRAVGTLTVGATVLPAAPAPSTTETTYGVKVTDLQDGFGVYELTGRGGEVLQSGVGDSVTDAFMSFAFRIEDGPDSDLPDS
jgi:hypothetical protein